MARNFKMFDHIVDPETRSKGWSFMRNRPLESFLISSFMYMLWGWFSYRSLFGAYIGLMCFSFMQQYGNYVMERIFDVFYKNIMDMMIRERNKMVMAHFTKPEDIDDGNEENDKEASDGEEGNNASGGEASGGEASGGEDEDAEDEDAEDVVAVSGNPFDNLQTLGLKFASALDGGGVPGIGGEEKSKIVESAVEEVVDSLHTEPVIVSNNDDNYLKLRKRQVPRT